MKHPDHHRTTPVAHCRCGLSGTFRDLRSEQSHHEGRREPQQNISIHMRGTGMRVSCIRILAAPSLYVRVHSQLRHVLIQTTAVTSHTCPVIHIHVRQLSSDVSSPTDMPHRILICYERVLLPDKSAEGRASCHEGQYCRT